MIATKQTVASAVRTLLVIAQYHPCPHSRNRSVSVESSGLGFQGGRTAGERSAPASRSAIRFSDSPALTTWYSSTTHRRDSADSAAQVTISGGIVPAYRNEVASPAAVTLSPRPLSDQREEDFDELARSPFKNAAGKLLIRGGNGILSA